MIGLESDGFSRKNESDSGNPLAPTIEEAEEDWTLKEAMKTKAFWAILICVGIPAMVNTGITFHIASIFKTNVYHLSSSNGLKFIGFCRYSDVICFGV